MRDFVEFEYFRVFVIQKRNGNNAHALVNEGSSTLRAGRPHSQAAQYGITK